MRQPISQRQFIDGLVAVIRVDGSEVTTTYAQTGLLTGKHIADVKKGTAGDANLVTIRFKAPFGLAPEVFIQPVTVNCVPRPETVGLSEIAIRTLQSDHATAANNCDFVIFVYGTEGIREGKY